MLGILVVFDCIDLRNRVDLSFLLLQMLAFLYAFIQTFVLKELLPFLVIPTSTDSLPKDPQSSCTLNPYSKNNI